MIQLFTIAIITGLLRAAYNYYVTKPNKTKADGVKWHFYQAAFIGTITVGLFYSLTIIDKSFLDYNDNFQMWLNIGLLSVYFLTPHWIVTDGFLNLFRGLHWFENNTEGDSIMDKLGGYKFYLQGFLLLVCIAITLNYYL